MPISGSAGPVEVEGGVPADLARVEQPALPVPADAERGAGVADVVEVAIDPGDRVVAATSSLTGAVSLTRLSAGEVDPDAGLVGVDRQQVGPDRAAGVASGPSA